MKYVIKCVFMHTFRYLCIFLKRCNILYVTLSFFINIFFFWRERERILFSLFVGFQCKISLHRKVLHLSGEARSGVLVLKPVPSSITAPGAVSYFPMKPTLQIVLLHALRIILKFTNILPCSN